MMNQRLSLIAGLAVFVFIFTSADDAQAQCRNRLLNKSFSCSFKSDSELATSGSTCLEFSDVDRLDPPKFELAEIGETILEGAALYSCTCDPAGNFARPRLNRSRERFSCSGLEILFEDGEEIFSPRALHGRIGPSGRAIFAHEVDVLAGSFILQCRLVSSCDDGLLAAQRLQGDNAVELERRLEEFSSLRAKRRLLEEQME